MMKRSLHSSRLINCLFEMENHVPVECEIQIHYRPILELKENEAHLFYGARAAGILETAGAVRQRDTFDDGPAHGRGPRLI